MSWAVLEPLVRSTSPEVRELVRRVADAADERSRKRDVVALADRLGGAVSALALSLAQAKPTAAQRLALDLVGRLKHVNMTVRQATQSLLATRTIPLSTRLAATRAMLRDLRHDQPAAVEVLRHFVTGLGRSRAFKRLDALVPRLRRAGPALSIVRAELLDRQRLRCPRCGAKHRRTRMARHLWRRHGLLLDGRRARTPWQSLDDRLGEPDPMMALGELHRAILRRGFSDEEAQTQLLDQAVEDRESLCPYCFTGVPLPDPPPLAPLETSNGRISGEGIAITISDSSFWPRLTIECPAGVVFDGFEPHQGPTARAFAWTSAGAAMLALAAATLVSPPFQLIATVVLLGIALLFWTFASRAAQRAESRFDRAIDYAWDRLVPHLGPVPAVSRLALASVGHGDAEARAGELNRCIDTVTAAMQVNALPAGLSPPLWWLRAIDDREMGRDPLPELIQRLGECFRGESPISCAAELMALAQFGLGSRGHLARLRVLGCEQAFAAGFSVGDMSELGRAFPVLANVLGLHDVDTVARLRLVWDERRDRPWNQCGPASTVFDLARYPVFGGQALVAEPDLLLFQPLPQVGATDEPSAVILCGRGLLFRQALIREMPDHVGVQPRPDWGGGGYEMRLGSHRFRYDENPADLAKRLTRWIEFGVVKFLPKANSVLRFRTSEQLPKLLAGRAVTCPHCDKKVTPVIGRIGLRAD